MMRIWAVLLAAVLMLAGCGKPPVLPVDPSVLTGEQCAAAGVRACTLLADGAGGVLLSVPGSVRRPAARAVAGTAGAARGGVRVLVSLPQQRLYLFRGRALVATSPVSTGRRGHGTPAGTFRVLEKAVTHHSNRYSNAPMPYMHRLTTYGIAIHAGALPGYPASHGCIRLPRAFARKLYAMTRRGTVVTITRARPRSAADALRLT